MHVALIWAMSRNRVIGRDGALPWRLRDDLRFFRRTTLGKPVVMGRRTYASIGQPLPGRTSIVLTRKGLDVAPAPPDLLRRAADWPEALAVAEAVCAARGGDECIVAGGAEIYRLALPEAARLYVTEVDAVVEGDTYFPNFDPAPWRTISSERFAAGAGNDYPFTVRVLERA